MMTRRGLLTYGLLSVAATACAVETQEESQVGEVAAPLATDYVLDSDTPDYTASGSSFRSSVRFDAPVVQPMVDASRLDYCARWGADCGKPAADAYCRGLGFGDALSFGRAADVGPTKLPTGQTCGFAACDGFTFIDCDGTGWTDHREEFLRAALEQRERAQATKLFEKCVDYKVRQWYKPCLCERSNDEGWAASEDDVKVQTVLAAARNAEARHLYVSLEPEFGARTRASAWFRGSEKSISLSPFFAYEADAHANDLHPFSEQLVQWAGTISHEWLHHEGLHHESQAKCGETTTFASPTWLGRPLDACLSWGTDCGQPAADAFCQAKGYLGATSFKRAYDVGPTQLIGGRTCNQAACDGFDEVVCKLDFRRYDNGKWLAWSGGDSTNNFVGYCVQDTIDRGFGKATESGTVSAGEIRWLGPYTAGPTGLQAKAQPKALPSNPFLQRVDVSLLVAKGAPDQAHVVCTSSRIGVAKETCDSSGSGEYWVGIQGVVASGYDMSIAYERPFRSVSSTEILGAGQWYLTTIQTGGETYVRVIPQTADVELYARANGTPTRSTHTLQSNRPNLTEERLYFTGAGSYTIGVYAPSAASFRINVSHLK